MGSQFRDRPRGSGFEKNPPRDCRRRGLRVDGNFDSQCRLRRKNPPPAYPCDCAATGGTAGAHGWTITRAGRHRRFIVPGAGRGWPSSSGVALLDDLPAIEGLSVALARSVAGRIGRWALPDRKMGAGFRFRFALEQRQKPRPTRPINRLRSRIFAPVPDALT